MADTNGYDRNKVIFKEDFNITVKGFNDIISEIDFKSEEEKILCKSIISSMEKYAAQKIKDNATVQIPYIGVVRKNPVKLALLSNKKELKELRKHTDKETYKNIIRKKAWEVRKEQERLDVEKVKYNKLIAIYKKEYEFYYKNIGPAFANIFIISKTWFKEIPFDREVQRIYDELNNRDNE